MVKGRPNSLYPQTGIAYTSGADGFVSSSRITGNYYRPDPASSFGILLTDAGTDTAAGLTASGDVITGNGFAAFNANADGSAVREAAPFEVRGSYLGQGNPVPGGPADPTTGVEAVSGPDTTSAATVTTPQRSSTTLSGVPTRVGAVVDSAPTAEVIDPAGGTGVMVGETVFPLVRGRDDFAVTSASLLVDGQVVDVATKAPYAFDWTPGKAYAGREVTFTGIVTDSSGVRTTSAPVTVSVAEETVAPSLRMGAVAKKRKAGTATIKATVNTAGKVVLKGGKVVKVVKRPGGARTITVPIKAKAPYRKVLNKKGRLKVSFTVTFRAASGGTVTRKRTVVLIKR